MNLGVILLVVVLASGLWAGLTMWLHPEQPIGRFSVMPLPHRTRVLGIVVTVATVVFAIFLSLGLFFAAPPG